MPDITNQQLLDALTDQLGAITENMATKNDVQEIVHDHTRGFATKDDLKPFATKTDLDSAITRLERKISSNQTVNIKHHLETRQAIGDLNHKFDTLREGLARAAEAI